MTIRRREGLVAFVAAVAAWGAAPRAAAAADAVAQLRAFVRDVHSGQADFTQTVTSADGARRRTSRGRFAFQRPQRFRFDYTAPYRQLIVADGTKVWVHDADLNQVTARRIGDALGATPAALLAGGALEPEFALAPLPSAGGLDWAEAVPRQRDGAFERLRVGFRDGRLAAVEVVDAFGQTSRLDFDGFVANAPVDAALLRFTVPSGADVIEQ